ncbi:TRADD-N-associated membrane domain-containing protein [Streptomyces sp. QTS52]
MTNRFGKAVDRERAALTEELLPESVAPEHPTPEEKDSAKFTKLLIRYYSYGLTQARASFYVSLFASIIGGGVLITGVGLAIFRADTIGDQYASIVSSVAGLLTVAIGTLFHKRADAALRHMESQSRGLREDMKVERDTDQAIQLLQEVNEDHLKSHLQAALILKFSGSEMPDLSKVVTRVDLFERLRISGVVTPIELAEIRRHLTAPLFVGDDTPSPPPLA